MASGDTSTFVATKFQHYCEFVWCIDGFSGIYQNLVSPTFSTADDCPLKWTIILEFLRRSYNSFNSNDMEIKLEILDKKINNPRVRFCYKFSCEHGNEIKSDSVEDIFPYILQKRGIEIARPKYKNFCFCEIKQISFTINEHQRKKCDKMKFQGNITIINCCQRKVKDVEVSNKYLPQLQIDFKSLLKNQQFTDVALNVENEVIRAHKFVLCARSPVFKRMFEQNFKEAVNNSVDVKDMEKSVLENFLEFLYSGVVEDRKFITVTALYSAADKYEVKTLQDACREILISCLSENTAPVILKLADMHNDADLKEIVFLFICNNFVKVELTTEWGQLLDTDPRLSSHTLRRVSTKITKP